MEEEFFFPSNVKTDYRFLVFGPKQLRRAVVGVPLILIATGFLLRKAPLWASAPSAALAAAVYIAAWCIPVFSEEQSVVDLWLKLRQKRRSQTFYPYRQGVDL